MYIKSGCFILLLSLLGYQSLAQKVFFDKNGKAADEANAYYYRENGDELNQFVSFYVNGDLPYFEGKITEASSSDESANKYAGECIWYFRNGKKKFVRHYNDNGKLEGSVQVYYESGKIWKEFAYKNGLIVTGFYSEYDEDGTKNNVFHESFDSNANDWDVYSSSVSDAVIKDGRLILTSLDAQGTSRYINLQTESPQFSLECKVNISKVKSGQRAGMIFGFKDWQNYSYFLISKDGFYIGSMYEGILNERAKGSYTDDIQLMTDNLLKVITQNEKYYYSINGEVQYSTSTGKLSGRNYGGIVTGKGSVASFDDLILKEFGAGDAASVSPADVAIRSTGSGLIISTNGYIVTNYHVIEDTKENFVEVRANGGVQTYTSKVVLKDEANDLAILQITDSKFTPFEKINYSIRQSGGVEVGGSVYTIGFPLALSGMGKDPKFSDGKISAKTGYNNAVNSFQTTIAVQPGNSGGPLFNEHGELLGIINASISNTDNVSYAIKAGNLMNLVDLLSDAPVLADSKELGMMKLEDQVKVVTSYVVLIKSK